MAAANGMAEFAGLRHNGLKFLLDPVDRFQFREVSADVEQRDLFASMVVGPSTPTHVESSCAVVFGQLGGTAE